MQWVIVTVLAKVNKHIANSYLQLSIKINLQYVKGMIYIISCFHTYFIYLLDAYLSVIVPVTL